MASINEVAEEQRAFWNGDASNSWIQEQEQRDQTLAPLGELAMARLRLVAGSRVLDIGTGCGDTSLELARRVGSDGHVLGVDLSEPMLARAEERRRAAGVAQLRLMSGDAATQSFPDAPFDAVFSRFGVMFFADPVAAFGNIRSAMRPDGRLAFVCWRPVAENAWVAIPREVVLRHVTPPPTAPDAPGQFSFADKDRVENILADAGFADIRFEAHDRAFTITTSRDLDAAVDAVMVRGPAGRFLRDADEATLAKVRNDMAPAIAPHISDEGLVLGCGVWVVSAGNP